MSVSPRPLPRFSLAATCVGHAVVLGLSAWALPWRSGTVFAAILTLLALLHLLTAAAAVASKPELLRPLWRTLAVASLVAFAAVGWSMAAAAVYVAKLYLRLGPSVASGILAAAVLFGLLTLPIAIWGARHTFSRRARSGRHVAGGEGLLLAFFVLTLPLAGTAARGHLVRGADARLTSDLANLLDDDARRPPQGQPRSVAGAGPAQCAEALDPERLTLLVAYVTEAGKPRSVCLQAGSRRDLVHALGLELERHARPGSTVVIDLIKSIKPLSRVFPLLDALEVRPGIDGVCEGQSCLPPWQLTLSDAFAENHPMPSIPDMSYGFSAEAVRRALPGGKSRQQRAAKAGGDERGIQGLIRIETVTFSADTSGVHRIVRTRTTPPAFNARSITKAVRAAQRYITTAQERDGTFRYSIDPESGKQDRATLNLPRQAGTTYALCELGSGRAVRRTVQRALAAFKPTEHRFGNVSALEDGNGFGLGKSALPLIALLRCRSEAGSRNDRLIGQLSRLMLELQRKNGSFYPVFDAKTGRGSGEHEILYAAGQAVLSLVLLEQRLDELRGGEAEPLPSSSKLRAVIDRAMDYYGGPYWPRPLRDFFFFEEGWHCLAARHALSSHRNEAYEQLCLDYVASRERFVAREGDTSEPNFVGGYGVSDLFPPRNTATAGLGEALDAAISIKRKRGLPTAGDEALLRDLIGFLMRAQWTEASCYACFDPNLVVGGFSQQLAAPDIRIDYVQHAMSAIGHGGELLFGK